MKGNKQYVSILDCIAMAAGKEKGCLKLSELDRYEKRYLAGRLREAAVGPQDASLQDWNEALAALGQAAEASQEQACKALYQHLEGC